LLLLLTTISCGSRPGGLTGNELQIGLERPGQAAPTYVTSVDCATLGDSSAVVAWTDESPAGGRGWVARVRLAPRGVLRLVRRPRLIDQGNVSNVTIFAYADSFAVLYFSGDQLFCQAPAGSPRRSLTVHNKQSPLASAGHGLDASHYLVAAILLQTHSGPPTKDIVLSTVGPDSAETILVGNLRANYVPLPPNPRIQQDADTLLVTAILPYGEFTSPLFPTAGSGNANGDAGAVVQMRLRNNGPARVVLTGVSQGTLPETAIIGKVHSFGLLGSD